MSVREKTRVYMSDGGARGCEAATPACGQRSPGSAGGGNRKKATEKQKQYILYLLPKVLEKYGEALRMAEEYRKQGLSLLPTLARDEMIAKITLKIKEMAEEDTLDIATASHAIEFLKNPTYSLLARYDTWIKLLK